MNPVDLLVVAVLAHAVGFVLVLLAVEGVFALEGRVAAAERAGVLNPGASGNLFATDAVYGFGNIAQSNLAISSQGARIVGYWSVPGEYAARFTYAGRVAATEMWEGGGREFTWAGSIPYEALEAFNRIPWSGNVR